MDEQNKKISLLLNDLTALESYIHDFFTFSPLPICFVSPLGVILEANPAFEKISNFSFGEVVGEAVEQLFDKQEIEILSKDTLKKGFVTGREMKFFPLDKKELICQIFSKTRKDEKARSVGYFLGIFDLTKLKKGEDELKKAQTALLNILEDTEKAWEKAEQEKNKTLTVITHFTDGLLLFNGKQELTLINPQAENFLKVKLKKVVGRHISELAKLENLNGLAKILGSKAGTGKKIKKVFRKEWEIKENLVLEVSTISLAQGRETAGTLVVLHDITREKIVERLKTEFVSISAHQLRTPLSAIKWTLKMLLDEDLGKITNEQKEFLEKTYRSNERMIALINSLLNVTRIEEGRFLYKPVLEDIKKIVEFVVDSFKDEIARKQIKFRFTKSKKPLPKVLVDSEKIKLVIHNLIDNAIRYTFFKGTVSISLKHKDKQIEFRIKDTGLGIPKNQQGRVFKKFFRGVNAVRLETEGSGLGLFIAKNIIEAHGGKIWFESKENQGATFYFTLPVKK